MECTIYYTQHNFHKQKIVSHFSAHLIGQLSLDMADRMSRGVFKRLTDNFGPTFELDCSALLEENRSQIEPIDELIFNSSLPKLTKQKRAFSVFNPTRSTSKFTLRTSPPFSIAFDKDKPMETVQVTLSKV